MGRQLPVCDECQGLASVIVTIGKKQKRYHNRYVRISKLSWQYWSMDEYAGLRMRIAAFKDPNSKPIVFEAKVSPQGESGRIFVPDTYFDKGEIVRLSFLSVIEEPEIPAASIMTVVNVLLDFGHQTRKEIILRVAIAPRTVGYALSKLCQRGIYPAKSLVVRVPNLRDMRRPLYVIDTKYWKELLDDAESPEEALMKYLNVDYNERKET